MKLYIVRYNDKIDSVWAEKQNAINKITTLAYAYNLNKVDNNYFTDNMGYQILKLEEKEFQDD